MTAEGFQVLAQRLQQGEPALFPTDTLPALAAIPSAAQAIWQLKQRPADKPLILMGASVEQLLPCLGQEPPAGWQRLAELGWPGALTLVLPARGPVVEALNPGGGGSLGLRVPACEAALQVLRCSGPLATSSANRSGEPACRTAAQLARCFPEVSRLAPEPWLPGSGQASTVVSWQSNGWRVLRQGQVVVPETPFP